MAKHLKAQYILSRISYDPSTGIFRYRPKIAHTFADVKWNQKYAHRRVGVSTKSNRYGRVWLDGRYYKAHRIAFVCMTGRFPSRLVDHINGNPSDNRWCNLREASYSQNAINRAARSVTGIKGIRIHRRSFMVDLTFEGKRYRKQFRTMDAAIRHYTEKAFEIHGAFAIIPNI